MSALGAPRVAPLRFGLVAMAMAMGVPSASTGCRRSVAQISAEVDAGAVKPPSSTAPEHALSPIDEALKLGAIGLTGDEAENFWEGIDSTQRQGRWVEATLLRRIPSGYASRFEGPFAPGRSIEHDANAWLPASDDLDAFLGSRIMCKVRAFDARRGAVVLAGDPSHERMRREVLARLVPGATLNARVSTVAGPGAFLALDDITDDLWLSTAILHVSGFGRDGAPKPGDRLTVTPEKPWIPSIDGRLFFVMRP